MLSNIFFQLMLTTILRARQDRNAGTSLFYNLPQGNLASLLRKGRIK